jgi:hypothetical protein
MKKIAVFLLLAFSLFGCSKESIDPDLASKVSGIYNVYYLQLGSDKLTLPISGISMSIELSKVSDKKANFIIATNNNGVKDTESATVDLETDGETVNLVDDGDRIGTVKGKELELNTISDGEVFIIRGKK